MIKWSKLKPRFLLRVGLLPGLERREISPPKWEAHPERRGLPRADLERVHVLRGATEHVVDVVAAQGDPSLDVPLLDGDVLVVLPRGAASPTAQLD